MGLIAEDTPIEANTMHTQTTKPHLRSFEFEKLPFTVRHRVYREVLLKPRWYDDQTEDSHLSEHEKMSNRVQELIIDMGEEPGEKYPAIMRTNKKIHEEAAAVLYGENWFTWNLCVFRYIPMWHWPGYKTVACPRRYSRLITRMHLMVSTSGDENDLRQAYAIFRTTTNLEHTCKVLTLNDLKILKVDFYNRLGDLYDSLGRFHGGSARNGYYGERCLDASRKCRAKKFLINRSQYAAELKAVIEGPKDAKFPAYRKATENEPDSDFAKPEEWITKIPGSMWKENGN